MSKQRGFITYLGIVFLLAMLVVSLGFLSFVFNGRLSANNLAATSKAQYIAEAGLEKAIWYLNNLGAYSGETETAFGGGEFTVTLGDTGLNEKTAVVRAAYPGFGEPGSIEREISATIGVDGDNISFNYGVQAGTGGFILSGGSTINGSVYANGSIVATNGVSITGSAVAANQPALAADQINETPATIPSCSASTCVNFANSASTEDFAQSFQISSPTPLNNIQFYIRKTGTPGNITVRVVTDNNGSPSTNTLMTGILNSAGVTNNFGWVPVTMPSNPVLDPSLTYWVVLDTASNNTRYYTIGANTDGYTNGQAKIGRYASSWANTTPSGLDGYFRLYLGGGLSTIGGASYVGGVNIGSNGVGDAWANTVRGANVAGNIYCTTGTNNNKPCNTTRADPQPQPLPITEGNIQKWKSEAQAGTLINGDFNVGWAGASVGPAHVTGNLLVNGGGVLTVNGTLWVEGTITLTGGGQLRLGPSFGNNNGVIVSDGRMSFSGGAQFFGSGEQGSYPFMVTTSRCPAAPECGGNSAITLTGGTGAVVLIAPYGNILMNGGTTVKQVTAKQITVDGGGTLVYDSGLVHPSFTGGPGGSWGLKEGSYLVK